ncbi:hypothetical protein Btru_061289 [Bulinus truncatus]|nr:hypothetical protein Btru_061289 [Bulinus truncatus]
MMSYLWDSQIELQNLKNKPKFTDYYTLRMIAKGFLYFYLLHLLVNAVAGNGVVTFNQDKDLPADDNIDQLLQKEQLIKVVDKYAKKNVKDTSSAEQTKSLVQATSSNAQAQKKEVSTTHNCTHNHQPSVAGAQKLSKGNSTVRLKWNSLEFGEELEEDYLPMGLDGDFVPGQDEMEHFRFRRAVANEIGSGENQFNTTVTLNGATMTDAQATEGNIQNAQLKNNISASILAFLNSKLPGRAIRVEVNKLARGSIISQALIRFPYDETHEPISMTTLAAQLVQMKTLTVNNKVYPTENIFLGDVSSASEAQPLECLLCDEYTACKGNYPPCVLKDDRLYPFGLAQGDSTMPKDDEFVTKRFIVQDYIPWNKQLVRNVSVNGFISIDEEFSSYIPRRLPAGNRKLLAVYWSDLDLVTSDKGQVYFQMYTKHGAFNKTIFNMANRDVVSNAGLDFYDASTVIVVTWYEVAPYPLSTSERVNFQCVIVTDGESAYAIYTYAQGAMNFDHVLQREVEVGFGNTNLDTRRVNYYTFDTVIGNTGQVGKWVFKIGEKENIRSKCLSWYQENLAVISNLNFWNSVIPRCPCNEISAFSSGQWIPSFEEDRCYDSFPRFGTFGRRCCYQGIRFGTFQSRIPMAGSLQAATPFGGRGVLALHERYDTLPKKWCCDQSNLCNLYYIVRPVAACINNVVNIASSIGDPHIVTLDQKTFTFNGLGEFKILEFIGPDPANASIPLNFQLQGRTCRAINAAGNVTNATVWCVLALSTSSKSTVRVEISSTGNTMVIYANGQDFTQKFRDSANFDEWTRDVNLRNVTGSLKVSTADNFGITITLANRLLEFTIDIDSKYKNMTKGLMGNFNGDNTDDLTYPNGTKLPSNSTEREIFSYGYSWVISEATSLFEYPYGTNYSSFLDRYNNPLFMDEVNASDKSEAEQKCSGPTNYACIYDFLVTKNEDLAKNSMRSSETFITQSSAIANKAPIINGSRSFNITLGATLRVDLICSDPDKDNFTVNITSKLDGFNSTFNIFSGILSITYSPKTITNETFQIVLTDSKGLDSQTYTANLTVCTNCSKHGDCDYTDLSTVTPYYSVTSCDCWLGYTGDNCELDKDGCSNSPCPAFTNCTDVPADVEVTTGKSYTCSACPAGFKLNANGTKCEDIDECINATRPCDANAICTNTIGSFQCTCKGGFRKQGSNCVDINECQENIHNCQHVCINEIPSFICACWEGFKLRTDNITCDKTSEADPCANLNKNCSYGCRNNSGSAECFCKVGFKLSTDGVSCEDIDECKQNLCSQACNNTIGSYACSCYTGYKISDKDKRICEACSNNKYGVNCDGTCECRGRALSCDNVRGCICISGWTGSDCSTDVDECQKPESCPRDQICRNTNGSFTCSCPSGYSLINGLCTNIDECASFAMNDCDQICTDNPGSFSCSCRPGFQRSNKTCLDIDECEADIDGCEHICQNTDGSYNCLCNSGYILKDDRKSCEKDINECTVTGIHQHKCSDHCVNLPGTYSCSCPIGKVLQNDKRTCQVCDSYHWGLDCINECGCYPIGSLGCDPVIGCKCKPGWAGTKCMQDIDECASDVSPCTQLSECKNTPGSFYCLCPTGYEMINGGTNGAGGTCVDIDECVKSNPCDQRCTNIVGSYHCSCYGTGFRANGSKCFVVNVTQACINTTCNQICDIVNDKQSCSCNAGYSLDQDGKTCLDVNECESTKPCINGQCHNVDGSFYCSCNNGTKLASDLVTCQDCEYGFYGENCSSTCLCNTTNTVLCNATNGQCDCKPGWDSDYCSVDIDECTIVSCPANARCINSPGSYRCVCHAGYYSNGLSCSRCDSSRYGQDCASTCSCNFANTVECNNTNGYCHCKSGWTGDTCALDIDECQDTSYCLGDYVHCFNLNGSAECNCMDGYEKPTINDTCQDIDECKNPLLNDCGTTGQCINTIGSYKCLCNLGYHEVNGRCTACNETSYGVNCTQMCSCVQENTLDCNDVSGACTCKQGWKGINCELDVDECADNNSFCPDPNSACINLNGSAICQCHIGFYKPNTTCEACDSIHYGENCASMCTCMTANMADCNDVNGTCSCISGWGGANCEQLVDQCSNASFCTNTHETCYNISGNPVCDCVIGFHKPSPLAPCEGCDPTHYGQNCSNICQCTANNFLDCNDVNGTCTCKPGWNGIKCDVDINECANVTYCTNIHEVCQNLNGSAECICDVGFSRPDNSTPCQACDSTHYGKNCSMQCSCNSSNTVDCNDVNGTCTCKPGWIGATCNQACDATHFGQGCLQTCQCIKNNTIDCNDVNGTCTCKPGWNGTNCEADIDECAINSSYCSAASETCSNLNGTAECLCKDGFFRPTLGSSCQACNATHYGYNCGQLCTCHINNTLDCNDVNGTCTCNPGWTGTNCDVDIDECISNTSYCLNPVEVCHNLQGSAECLCKVGFHRPALSASCQACNTTHYGYNCGELCTCDINNTLDCNDVNGTCTCNPGWTGTNCDVDIDECISNTSYCLNSVEVCHNLNGSAECLCKVGYYRPTLSTSCQACDSTHYGENCASVCPCMTANTADCNDVNGTCTCKPGWTGTICDKLVDQCSNTSFCTNVNETCYNTTGTPTCDCVIGFTKPIPGAPSQACDATHYGQNCSNVCRCVINNSIDCSDTNGTCTCHSGWNGTNCEVDIDECVTNSSYCSGSNEKCHNLNGSAECICLVGHYRPTPGASCQACNTTHFGNNCGQICTCHENNTLDCNDVNGTCTCRNGWTGTNCDVDIDECISNTSYCLNSVEVCHNLNGSAECLCKVGYYKPTLSTSCQACDSTHYGENCASVCPCMTANTADCDDVNGTCTCNPGWTGAICDKLVDQCSNTSFCTNVNETCYNTTGTPTCDCVIGFTKPTPGAPCQACDATHYGQNCSNVCGCVVNNSIDCSDTNGTCTCQPGWNGINCEVDIDECVTNSSYCSGSNEKCHNLNGSAECICQVGHYRPTPGASCQACNATHFGNNCGQLCTCDINNTLDCNDLNGMCTCNPGWTGTNCDVDIDECTTNTSYCLNSVEVCHNLNGSAECLCKTGYHRPAINASCQACDSTHYGENCASLCRCMTANTADCNDVNGTCTCNPGWTGAICDKLVDQCSNTSFCTNVNETCYNTTGTPTCDCVIGFTKPTPGAPCQACDATHYGQNCSNVCSCVVNNSIDCSDTNGTCTCKPGWNGTNCEVDINECVTNSSYCPGSNEKCHNLNGSAECICQVGHYRPTPGASCQACNTTHFGNNCGQLCTCHENNTLDCNDVNGTCTCRNGWTGTICDVDIDECTTNTSYCLNSVEVCHNLNGSAECLCKVGYYRPTLSTSCQACDSTHYGENCASVCPCMTANTADCNDVNGTCTCNPGWTGTICDKLVDQCSNTSFCTNDHETCYNTTGTAICDCVIGFTKPTPGAPCQACDATHYGQNCSNVCGCVVNNSIDCSDTNGTCTCQPGWNGINCEVDIDECVTNSSYCSGSNEKCHNLNGSAECICQVGHYRPTPGASCQACDSLHYGQNCGSSCTCEADNTEDCNDVTGTCTCKPDWTGTKCDQVIRMHAVIVLDVASPPNEIFTNTSDAFKRYSEQLINQLLDVSYKIFGYNKFIIIITHFTHGSIEAHTIFQLNDTSVSTANATANQTSEIGANTATSVTKLFYEIPQTNFTIDNQTYSVSHISFNNNNLTSEDSKCDIYQTTNKSCEICNWNTTTDTPVCTKRVCDSTHFGQNCSLQCACNTSNTEDCDDVNGTCTCNPGWGGNNCSQACDASHFGPNCMSTCTCNMSNTAECNDVNGTCTCSPGWSGISCNQACDASHFGPNCMSTCTCNISNTADCNDANGTCTCNSGWSGSNCNQENLKIATLIIINMTSYNEDIFNHSSTLYNEYKENLTSQLKSLSSFKGDKITIIITNLTKGSLNIHAVLTANEITNNQATLLTQAILEIAKMKLTIDDQLYIVLKVGVSYVNITSDSSECEIYKLINTSCQVCQWNQADKLPQCSNKATSNDDLIIGLAVGIPLFVIFAVIISVCVWLYVKRKSSKHLGPQSEDRDTPFGKFFATRLDPKGSWGTPSLYKADAYSEAGTSQNSRDGHLIKKTKKKSPELQDSAWYSSVGTSTQAAPGQDPGQVEPPAGQAASNFSWDYMFQLLEPHKGFEIQRPNVSPSPNPAFLKRKDDSNA